MHRIVLWSKLHEQSTTLPSSPYTSFSRTQSPEKTLKLREGCELTVSRYALDNWRAGENEAWSEIVRMKDSLFMFIHTNVLEPVSILLNKEIKKLKHANCSSCSYVYIYISRDSNLQIWRSMIQLCTPTGVLFPYLPNQDLQLLTKKTIKTKRQK